MSFDVLKIYFLSLLPASRFEDGYDDNASFNKSDKNAKRLIFNKIKS